MPILDATRMTTAAAWRLARAREGRVHSIFARTVNLELDGPRGANWLSLHDLGRAEPLPAPFGIACAPWPPLKGLAGVAVRIAGGAIVLDGRLRIEVAGARPCPSTLPTPAPPLDAASGLALAGVSGRGGLLPVVGAWLAGKPVPPDPLARLAAPALAALAVATRARDAAGCVAAARPLLGLGPGLTPAGDDGLMGWAIGAWSGSFTGRGLVQTAARGLLALARERTGPLSRAFLAAALAGDVAEPVRALVLRPDHCRLAAVLALGATSGADLLAGFLLAREALASPSDSPAGKGSG